jgi:hypothetical protein
MEHLADFLSSYTSSLDLFYCISVIIPSSRSCLYAFLSPVPIHEFFLIVIIIIFLLLIHKEGGPISTPSDRLANQDYERASKSSYSKEPEPKFGLRVA